MEVLHEVRSHSIFFSSGLREETNQGSFNNQLLASAIMAESKPFPTTLILDFYDSYTRNVLSLFSQLAAQSRTVIGEGRKSQWEVEGWQDRVVVVNVDSITW